MDIFENFYSIYILCAHMYNIFFINIIAILTTSTLDNMLLSPY